MAIDQGESTYLDHPAQDIDDTIEAVPKLQAAVTQLVNSGGKNTMNYTLANLKSQNSGGSYGFSWSDNVCTSTRGATFTVNSDMSITVNASNTTGDIWFLVKQNHVYNAGSWVLSGCPTGGSTSTYFIESDNKNARDTGESADVSVSAQYTDSIYIIVKSGQTFELTFRPMICSSADWAISQEFEQYCPTLPELYQMILAL